VQVARSVTELRAEIEAAFGAAEVPPAETVLAERYRDAVDPGELLAAFRGKHWRDLGRRDLFLHRESLSTLSARGFRAYLAAYLFASLEGEEAPDLVEHVLFSLYPLSSEARDADETRERLSALDGVQREAIRSWLEHFKGESALAAKILQHWS
jgi:hypothetical protein